MPLHVKTSALVYPHCFAVGSGGQLGVWDLEAGICKRSFGDGTRLYEILFLKHLGDILDFVRLKRTIGDSAVRQFMTFLWTKLVTIWD